MMNTAVVIKDAFARTDGSIYGRHPGVVANPVDIVDGNAQFRRFLEVPIDGDDIEVPLFVMGNAITALSDNRLLILHPDLHGRKTDTLVVSLYCNGYEVTNKTADPIFRTLFNEGFPLDRLVKVAIPGKDFLYYGSSGILLDRDMKPLMICSWRLHRAWKPGNGDFTYQFVRPVMRIAPSVFLERKDIIQAYCGKGLVEASLEAEIVMPHVRSEAFVYSYRHIPIQIIIEDCPFAIRGVEEPTLHTTDESLRNVALQYIGEL